MKYAILLFFVAVIFVDGFLIDNREAPEEVYTIASEQIAAWFPQCQPGDTVKACIKSLYWRNGDGIPYSWVVPQPLGTAYGVPMEFNFFDNCDSPGGIGGAGTQHLFFINLFEGEYEQIEIVIGWGLDYGLSWMAPSTVQGQPLPLGAPAMFAIYDQDCDQIFWPSSPVQAFPVAQQDPTCASCPMTPPPDTSNYWYTPGFNQSCKIVHCPPN